MAVTDANSSGYSTNDRKGKGIDGGQLENEAIKMLLSLGVKLEEVSSFQSRYIIYSVPMHLRNVKPEAYASQSISIGPLHYNEEEYFRSMETHKLRYLKCLLDRHHKDDDAKVMRNLGTLSVCFEEVNKLEEEARKYYSEIIMVGFGKDEFVKMMVMDGCFILEFLRLKTLKEVDHFLSDASWFSGIMFDLIKFENQLPFFVLEKLYDLIFIKLDKRQYNTFSHHIYGELLKWFVEGLHGPTVFCTESHLQLVAEGPNGTESVSLLPQVGPKHLLHLLHQALVSSSLRTTTKKGEEYLCLRYCASDLNRARVIFRKKENSSLFDIDFDKVKKVLRIPTIVISDKTEVILRNLIAFEQSQQSGHYFTAYAAFMHGLIDTSKDVELLVRKGIITNFLGSTEDVVTLFDNLCKYLTVEDPYFSGVIKDLKDICGSRWNILRDSIASSLPTISVILTLYGSIFTIYSVVFTAIQTYCSLKQLELSKK